MKLFHIMIPVVTAFIPINFLFAFEVYDKNNDKLFPVKWCEQKNGSNDVTYTSCQNENGTSANSICTNNTDACTPCANCPPANVWNYFDQSEDKRIKQPSTFIPPPVVPPPSSKVKKK